MEDLDYERVAWAALLGTVALPVVWVLSLLAAPFLLVWLAWVVVRRAIIERNGVEQLRAEHAACPIEWHAENFRGCCGMLGAKEAADIEGYIRVKKLYARYSRQSPLHDRDDDWWEEVIVLACKEPAWMRR